MVKLVVEDYEQMTMLEEALINAGISYDLELVEKGRALRPPYLVVDGAPLDMQRAMKWIGGHANE